MVETVFFVLVAATLCVALERTRRIDPGDGPRPAFRSLAIPFLVAALTRSYIVARYHPGHAANWGGEMPAIASSIAQGLGFASPYFGNTGASAMQPPVYPYLLAGLFKLFGYTPAAAHVALAINVMLSAMTVLPLTVLARQLFDQRSATIAAWFWALYPLVGHTDALYVWNTSLYVLALATFLALAISLDAEATTSSWGVFGLLTGLLLLTDPSSLTAISVTALWLLGRFRRTSASFTHRIGRVGLAALIAVSLPSLWLVRNYSAFHEFVFLRSGFWFEVDVGVRDFELADERLNSLPNRNPAELQRYRELGELRYISERGAHARQWIAEHSAEYTVRAMKRVVSFWTGRYVLTDGFWPLGGSVGLKYLVYAIPVIGALICLIGMWRMGHPALWWCVGMLALFPLPYYITHTMPRYRLPLEALLICLTSGAWFAVRQRRTDA